MSRQYVDLSTVGDQNVYANSVVVRPSIGTDQPDLGLFITFAAAYAAALDLPVPMRTIYIDAPGSIVPIPAGTYDLSTIRLVGYPTASSGVTGIQRLQTAVGTFFTSFVNGAENIWLDHLGTAPLYTASPAAPNALRIRTGRNSLWSSSGNAAPVVLMSGTGGLIVDVEDGSAMTGDTPGTYEIFELSGAPGEIQINLYDNSSLSTDSLRGPALSTINLFFVGVGPLLNTQANFAGTLAVFRGAAATFYDGLANANYVLPGPSTAAEALARMESALVGLLAGPIP
jgi:hypothetical protein